MYFDMSADILPVRVQFAWRPSSQEGVPPEAAVVTSAGRLLHGCLGGALRDFLRAATSAACCAWSADGSALGYATGDVVTVQRVAPAVAFSLRIESQVHATVSCNVLLHACTWIGPMVLSKKLIPCLLQEAKQADADLSIDTLAWVGERAILVSGTLHPREKPGGDTVVPQQPLLNLTSKDPIHHCCALAHHWVPEQSHYSLVWQDVAPVMLLQWACWDEAVSEVPEDLQLAEFYPAAVNPDAAVAEAGQRLHVTGVPAWSAIVAARGKASDDHIKLYGALLFHCDNSSQLLLRTPRSVRGLCMLCRGWPWRGAQVS